jgi:DNA-binding transcriptional regulator LsrR (DeoR family)
MATPSPAEGSAQDRSALIAAELYYMQDLTMDTIARELHTSRSTVSRLLQRARTTGLVTIRIHGPSEQSVRLRQAIRDDFGVSAYLVPVPERIPDVDRLERVATSAARILDRFIESNMTVGVAWGATVNAVSRHLTPRPLQGTEFIQLNGAGNTFTTGVGYTSEILRRFGEAFTSAVEDFPVPAFFDDPVTKKALWRERSIARVLAKRRRMSIALFSVGAPDASVPSHVYAGGYLDAADRAALFSDGVAGDAATVFYRADGSTSGIRINERASGPDLDELRQTPRRICVVSGPSKVESLRGALAAELITDLVIDEQTARELLAAPRPRRPAPEQAGRMESLAAHGAR